MQASANVIWDPDVLHDLKYLCSLTLKKIQGATINSFKDGLLEDGKVKLGKVQTVLCGYGFFFFPFFFFFPTFFFAPFALDGRHC